jgi:hypothetical protein
MLQSWENRRQVSPLKLESDRLLSAFFLEVIALCLIASSYYVDIGSTAMLLIFNFLFLSLILGLNGKLNRKLCLLAFGNIVGLAWNILLSFFAVSANAYSGGEFAIIFQIVRPLLNFFWIISFWSLSLSALPNPKGSEQRRKLDS